MRLASDARAIARAGIRAVDPGRAVRSVVRRYHRGLAVDGRPLVPDPGGEVRVVALGKAAGSMVDATVALLGRTTPGVAAIPRGYPAPRSRLRVVWGDHPVPSAASVAAGRVLLEEVRTADPRDRILFLVSGGGSAVADVPAESISVTDLRRTTQVLLDSGAPIQAMNSLRRHLSSFKGGWLAKASRPGGFATVAVSDVVGDPPADVASGPTVPDPTTFQDALGAVRRWSLRRRLPEAVMRYLTDGARHTRPETPKPEDPVFKDAVYRFAATNRTALEAARTAAERLGYRTRIERAPVVGETQKAAREFASALVRRSVRRPFALLAGGETTVALGPHPGRGGRNQEFALAAARTVAGRPGLLVLSVGSDGIDGPTDAAGGWVGSSTVACAEKRGVRIDEALWRHATYDALRRLGTLLTTGATGTNVMDVHVGLAGRYSGYGGK
jgi:glycerate 2-kinase